MAIVKNFWLKGAKKRLAGAVIYQSGGQTVQRMLAETVSNPRTQAQMSQRVKWANVVNIYKANKSWMKYAFETKAKNQSEYNKLMSLNVSNSRVFLTKQAAASGACVVAPYIVTQGSLPSITYTEGETAFTTNLYLGQNPTITEESTVGAVAKLLLDNNPGMKQGDQISFIRMTQLVNEATGYPYVVVRKYEVLLDPTSDDLFYNFMPFGIFVADGDNKQWHVNVQKTGNAGGFALILSRTESGKTSVSTQSVAMVDNAAIYAAYTSNEALQAAIKSYGSSDDAFLTTDNANYGENEFVSLVPLSISYDNVTRTAGSYVGEISNLDKKRLKINFNRDFDETVKAVYIDVYDDDEPTATMSSAQVSGTSVIVPEVKKDAVKADSVVESIRVFTGSTTYQINFAAYPGGLE